MANNLAVTGNVTIGGTLVVTGTTNLGAALDTDLVTNFNADKVDGADLDTDGTLAANSDVLVPSQKAVKTYADTADALKANDNAVVKLTGDQTVAGVKTFSSDPVATVPSVRDQGTGAGLLKCKVIQIDDWNMVASASKSIAHGLTLGKIRFAKALIRHDLDTTHYDLNQGNASTGFLQGWIAFDATNITLLRLTGGVFDNVGFDSTSYNRGWITIWYEV